MPTLKNEGKLIMRYNQLSAVCVEYLRYVFLVIVVCENDTYFLVEENFRYLPSKMKKN